MKKFRKLVAIEPVSLVPEAENELGQYAEEVVLYPDIPADDAEIIRRIGDADGVLVSYTSVSYTHLIIGDFGKEKIMTTAAAAALGIVAVLLAVQFKGLKGEYGTYLSAAAGAVIFSYGLLKLETRCV